MNNLKKILWKLDLYKYKKRINNGYEISIMNLIKEQIYLTNQSQ